MEIFSIGDINFLIDVLNGVAMLFNAGIANDQSYIASGFIIGMLLMLIRSIMTSRFEMYHMLTAFAFYSVLFVPRVDVTVEDVYTGATQNVADIPLGVAMVGSVFSSAGYFITRDFETVFSTPGMTTYGFLDPLETVIAMNDIDLGNANFSNADAQSKDLTRTVHNYLTDCVIRDMNTSGQQADITISGINSAPDLLAYFTSLNAPGWFTTRYLTAADMAAGGSLVNCQTLATELNAEFADANFRTEFQDHLEATRGVTQIDIEDVMTELLGQAANAVVYRQNALLATMFNKAAAGYNTGSSLSTYIERTAIEQRRVQEAAERTLFEEIARPLMTWVEALFYVLSPFAAFLVTLGPYGFRTVARYLQVGLWVHMWMPLMAVVNLYTFHAIDNRFADLLTQVEPISYGGLSSIFTEAQTYLGVAGTLAAAVPAMSLVIVTGGAYALVNAANRIQGSGADHTSEKVASPDLAGQVGVGRIAVGTQMATQASGGGYGIGNYLASDPTKTTYSERSLVSDSVSSQRQAVSGARAQFLSDVGRAVSTGSGVQTTTGALSRSAAENISAYQKGQQASNAVSSSVSSQLQTGKSGEEALRAISDFGIQGGIHGNVSPGKVISSLMDYAGETISGRSSSMSPENALKGAARNQQASGNSGFAKALNSVASIIGASAKASLDGSQSRQATTSDSLRTLNQLSESYDDAFKSSADAVASYRSSVSNSAHTFTQGGASQNQSQTESSRVSDSYSAYQQAVESLSTSQQQLQSMGTGRSLNAHSLAQAGANNWFQQEYMGSHQTPEQKAQFSNMTPQQKHDAFINDFSNRWESGDIAGVNEMLQSAGISPIQSPTIAGQALTNVSNMTPGTDFSSLTPPSSDAPGSSVQLPQSITQSQGYDTPSVSGGVTPSSVSNQASATIQSNQQSIDTSSVTSVTPEHQQKYEKTSGNLQKESQSNQDDIKRDQHINNWHDETRALIIEENEGNNNVKEHGLLYGNAANFGEFTGLIDGDNKDTSNKLSNDSGSKWYDRFYKSDE